MALRAERRPAAQVGTQDREGWSAVGRVEQLGRPAPTGRVGLVEQWLRRSQVELRVLRAALPFQVCDLQTGVRGDVGLVGPGTGLGAGGGGVLGLGQRDRRVGFRPGPVVDRGVLRGGPYALRRQLLAYQRGEAGGVLDGLGGIDRVAVGVLRAEVLADELVGGDGLRRGDPVAERGEVGLQGVVDPPEAPHARHVVLGDVAVEQQVANGVLDAAGAPFELEVVGLARSDRLGIEPVGGHLVLRVLVQPGVGVVPRRVGDRVHPPAVTTTVQVVDVELLAAGVADPELGGVTDVAAGHRGRWVAEGVRRVRVRLLLAEGEQPVAEGLRTVVERELPRAVAAGGGVHLREP